MPRHCYILDLGTARPPVPRVDSLATRSPSTADVEALALLMVDAYTGTIDYDGETVDEARMEVAGYFDGEPILEHSWLGVQGGAVVSACLVSKHEDHPLIGYVMTAAHVKNQGLAASLLGQSLDTLQAAGYTQVSAWITEDNVPSETIFLRAGFSRPSSEPGLQTSPGAKS